MKYIKNIVAGFCVSFAGAIPFGYLNLIGSKIFATNGGEALFAFVIGVVIIEMIIIYASLHAAKWFIAQKKFLTATKVFSVIFLAALSVWFFLKTSERTTNEIPVIAGNFFWAGLLLSAINFLQIPFWCGWSVVLLSKKKISTSVANSLLYVAAAGAGTVAAMLLFALLFQWALVQFTLSAYIINKSMAIIFLVMAVWQVYKLGVKKSAMDFSASS
jgi:hypothetical protein